MNKIDNSSLKGFCSLQGQVIVQEMSVVLIGFLESAKTGHCCCGEVGWCGED